MSDKKTMDKLKNSVRNIVPPEYQIYLEKINREDISFQPFRGRKIRDICLTSCDYSKICGNCPNPQNNYNRNAKKEILDFNQGLLVLLRVPSKEFAGKDVLRKRRPAKSQEVLNGVLKKLKRNLKTKGFNRFYSLGGGPCKLTYCFGNSCSLLEEGYCKHPNFAVPSMESHGINVFETALKQGHRIYPIISTTLPKNVPYGTRVGLLMYSRNKKPY